MRTLYRALGAALGASMLATPVAASACACGCGIFDVGDNNIMPQSADSGLTVFFRTSYMDQDRNREGSQIASPDDNSDKRIKTGFYTLGAEYMINAKWSVMAQLPLYDRHFTTTGADRNGNPVVETVPVTDLGDAMFRVTYTGFSPDMSTGVFGGLKLPTGRYTSPLDQYGGQPYDRDSLPGTGSTDFQIGGYHAGALANRLAYFGQALYQVAFATRDGYRPGNELDGAIGLSYDLTTGGSRVGVKPVLQLLGSVRAHDTGVEADPLNSGYRRLLLAPGVRLQLTRKMSVYGDVEFPIAQSVNSASSVAIEGTAGQLTAPALFKLQLNYGF